MKDTVIKGDGTSRTLKAPASMPETFGEWRSQLLAGNATMDIGLNPAGCDVVGTAMSKANLLSGTTEEALGLSGNDPTVNDALYKLLQKGYSKEDSLSDTTKTLFGLNSDAVPDDVLEKLSKAALAKKFSRYTELNGPLSEVAQGSLIWLDENGAPTPFYVVKHDYESGLNGAGRTLLLRKDGYDLRQWNSTDVNTYATSTIDAWLNDTYRTLLSSDVQTEMSKTKFYYSPGNGNNTVTTLERSVFLLSGTEMGGKSSDTDLNVEGSVLPTVDILKFAQYDGENVNWWLRSPSKSNTTRARSVHNETGGIGNAVCTYTSFASRPAFTLPGNFYVTRYVDEDGNYYPEQVYDPRIVDVFGALVDIPADQVIGATKIATGSYAGTGTYGSSNPCSLTFDFEPKYIFIKERGDSYFASIPVMSLSGDFTAYGYLHLYATTSVGVSSTDRYAKINGNTVSWYSSNANAQMNKSGSTFFYLAIG